MDIIDKEKPRGEFEALTFNKGFMYDMHEKRWTEFLREITPFHTLMFPKIVFADEGLYYKRFIGDFTMVYKKWTVRLLPADQFIVLIHGDNWESTFNALRWGNPDIKVKGGLKEFLEGKRLR